MTQASAPMTDKRILIAKIAQSHGVRGLVKLHLYTDTPEILDTATLYKGEHGKDTIKLILKNPMGKYWLAEIDGITDRTAADHLRHQEIWIDRDALPPVDENEFYYASEAKAIIPCLNCIFILLVPFSFLIFVFIFQLRGIQ